MPETPEVRGRPAGVVRERRAPRSRPAGSESGLTPALATGILLPCGTMFPRMVLVLAVTAPGVFLPALLPLAVMALVVYGASLRQWRISSERHGEAATPLTNPLELHSAIGFGALLALALVMVTAKGVEVRLGGAGLLPLAAASGLADVDAITLSLAGMSREGLDPGIAVSGVVVAAAANCLVKGAMASAIGGKRLGLAVALPLVGSAVLGLLAVWLTLW